MSLIFSNFPAEAIVRLVQKELHTSKLKQKITSDRSPEFCGNSVHAKISPERISQSNGSIGRPLGFVIGKLNTSASLYRLAPRLKGQRRDVYLPRTKNKNVSIVESWVEATTPSNRGCLSNVLKRCLRLPGVFFKHILPVKFMLRYKCLSVRSFKENLY